MSGPLPIARLDLLAESLAYGLIRHFDITRPPVPIFEMVRRPPVGLERHLSLCLALPYSDAIYLRLLNGQGTIFVNPRLSHTQQRFATARAMLLGLFNSPGGHEMGLGVMPIQLPEEAAEYFARCLLMPAHLMPTGWRTVPIGELSQAFDVPPEAAAARVVELEGRSAPRAGLLAARLPL